MAFRPTAEKRRVHMSNKASDASHETEVQLGGDTREQLIASRRANRALVAERIRAEREARKRLPIWADIVGFHPTNDPPPATRAQCPDTSRAPCPYVKCRHHTYTNHNPAGRPDLASVPRDEKTGFTRSVTGIVGEDRSEAKLDASQWLRWGEAARSCALAVIEERGALGVEAIGKILGRHRTLIAREVKGAIRKLKKAGVTVDEFYALLDEEHENGPKGRAGWWLDQADAPRRNRQSTPTLKKENVTE